MIQHPQRSELVRVLERLPSAQVLVVGDLLLDRYTWGDAERISQEAPVIVLRSGRQESRLGGAANVCAMLRGLDVQAACLGVVGDDVAGQQIRAQLLERQIDSRWVITDPGRPTTVKERFVGSADAKYPNQILRVDRELRDPIPAAIQQRLIQVDVAQFDAVLISDYGKGVCTHALTEAIIEAGRRADVPVLVDPARGKDYGLYRGATVLKPNRAEAAGASGRMIRTPSDALEAAVELCGQFAISDVVITLDSDGMVWVSADGSRETFPTRVRSICDITGAGDMVLAMLGACWARYASPEAAIMLANIAGGIEVERRGVSVVTRAEIRHELFGQQYLQGHCILSPDQLAPFGIRQREQGRRIVFTNGCFDLLHVGHVMYLAEAAALGDLLVVGVNSDASVQRLKGPSRPVISESDRAVMLAALECVDAVVVFDEDTPHRLLHALRPDVLVKGGTYSPDEVVGREIVEAYGGQVHVTGMVDGISTTRILRSLQRRQTEQAGLPLRSGIPFAI